MSPPARKYLSEFAVHLCSARFLVTTAADLASGRKLDDVYGELADACHIYLIVKRPSAVYDKASFEYKNATLKGKLNYKLSGEPKSADFEYPFPLLDDAVSIRLSEYPNREIEIISSTGKVVRRLPAGFLSTSPQIAEQVFKDLEVLYVGQAYADGKRSAFDRLKSHSTLQRILAETQYNHPDDEVMLLAFEYAPYSVISIMDGGDNDAIRDETDSARFISILDNPLTKHQQICLAEAGLIRFFQPKYNEIYKASFPAEDQKILNQCYELDFSGLVVEIDTAEVGLKLFSPTVAAADHHLGQFDLIDPAERRSFFTLVTQDGKIIEMPDVIQPSR